mmetsp:Transcript_24374/g.47865  ORF Transcript_24374/g.47865 Transcript_24374/m.47865 type:complete len:103 (+) Transcript_24374:767-1075(+)
MKKLHSVQFLVSLSDVLEKQEGREARPQVSAHGTRLDDLGHKAWAQLLVRDKVAHLSFCFLACPFDLKIHSSDRFDLTVTAPASTSAFWALHQAPKFRWCRF